jgi:hypothetical protein
MPLRARAFEVLTAAELAMAEFESWRSPRVADHETGFTLLLGVQTQASPVGADLKGLSNLNVLIGRNNTGKSAVLGVLQVLNIAIYGQSFDWASVLTAKDSARALEVRLVMELSAEERTRLTSSLVARGEPNCVDRMLASPLARRVEYLFRSAVGAPHLLHLRHTRLLAEDGQWALVQQFKQGDDDRGGNPGVGGSIPSLPTSLSAV